MQNFSTTVIVFFSPSGVQFALPVVKPFLNGGLKVIDAISAVLIFEYDNFKSIIIGKFSLYKCKKNNYNFIRTKMYA